MKSREAVVKDKVSILNGLEECWGLLREPWRWEAPWQPQDLKHLAIVFAALFGPLFSYDNIIIVIIIA